MSLEVTGAEHVCYVHCNFCNTVLAVSVPCSSLFSLVTVRCGHCANLLSVNMGGSLQLQQIQRQKVQNNSTRSPQDYEGECGSSSKSAGGGTPTMMNSSQMSMQQGSILPIRPPEKRQRVPSAYNRFIKEEIQRIKANNPDISHREAFSAAAKNWAHFPRIHFGLSLETDDKQTKIDQVIPASRGKKSQAFC